MRYVHRANIIVFGIYYRALLDAGSIENLITTTGLGYSLETNGIKPISAISEPEQCGMPSPAAEETSRSRSGSAEAKARKKKKEEEK